MTHPGASTTTRRVIGVAVVGIASLYALAQTTSVSAHAQERQTTAPSAPLSEPSPTAAPASDATSSPPPPSNDGTAAPTPPDSAASAPVAGAQEAPATDTATAADAPPPFLDLRSAAPVTGDAAAGKDKAAVCSACHGENGIAIAPTFPNLAGQRIDYLYWQLREFKTGTSAMTPLVADLSDQDMRNLAAYFARMPTQAGAVQAQDGTAQGSAAMTPVEPADQTLLEHGQALYTHGVPEKGIPPCQGCHGADARGFPHADVPDRAGHRPFATYPALRGQQSIYLQTKLAEFQAGTLHDSSTDLVMSHVGSRLDPDTIQAVSTWLSSLPP